MKFSFLVIMISCFWINITNASHNFTFKLKAKAVKMSHDDHYQLKGIAEKMSKTDQNIQFKITECISDHCQSYIGKEVVITIPKANKVVIGSIYLIELRVDGDRGGSYETWKLLGPDK